MPLLRCHALPRCRFDAPAFIAAVCCCRHFRRSPMLFHYFDFHYLMLAATMLSPPAYALRLMAHAATTCRSPSIRQQHAEPPPDAARSYVMLIFARILLYVLRLLLECAHCLRAMRRYARLCRAAQRKT